MIRRGAPALVLAAIVVGAITGMRAGSDGVVALVVAVTAACVAGLAARADRRVAAVLALFAIGASAYASGARAVHGLDHPPFGGAVAGHELGTLRGAVVGDPRVTPWRVSVIVRGTSWAGERGPRESAGTRSVLVVAARAEASRLRSLEAGDRVAVRGRMGPLDGFDARLRLRHVVARLDDAGLVDLAPGRAPVLRVANRIRALVERGGAGLPARERGVLAAFLLGDERAIPPATVATFRAAGMSHLLVVSGANVAAVLALVAPITRRAPLVARLAIGAVVLAVFGAATRWEPSVLRAIVMALVVLVGAVLGRPVRGVRVLCLAVSVLLLADPLLLRAVGFLLSCGATAGIALFAHLIAVRLPGPSGLRQGIAVTLAAQIGVAPVLVPTFGSMPLVALPANLLAAPLVVPITAWGLAAGLVGGVLGGTAARVLQTPTLLALRVVEGVAALAARHPGAVDGRGLIGVVAVTAAAGAFRCLRAAGRSGSGVRTRR